MPMHRWMQSAAGGTSQRLKPAVAMMRSRSRMLVMLPPPAGGRSIVVMRFAPAANQRAQSGRSVDAARLLNQPRANYRSIDDFDFAIAKSNADLEFMPVEPALL